MHGQYKLSYVMAPQCTESSMHFHYRKHHSKAFNMQPVRCTRSPLTQNIQQLSHQVKALSKYRGSNITSVHYTGSAMPGSAAAVVIFHDELSASHLKMH